MDQLAALRAQIDEIDARITHLFEQRMDVVRQVGRVKGESQAPVLQPQREKQVLDGAVSRLNNKEYAPAVRQLFETMMAQSRAFQQRDRLGEHPMVAYPGERGAFSHQAALTFFGSGASFEPYPTFEEAARALARAQADYALWPVENSLAGKVEGSMELLKKYHLEPVGWQVLAVRQCLWGLKGARLENIDRVLSHPHALAQCAGFLENHPHMQPVKRLNTALAAQEVSWGGDVKCAAIAGPEAGVFWGLTLLEKDIQDGEDNHTRFVVAGRGKEG